MIILSVTCNCCKQKGKLEFKDEQQELHNLMLKALKEGVEYNCTTCR